MPRELGADHARQSTYLQGRERLMAEAFVGRRSSRRACRHRLDGSRSSLAQTQLGRCGNRNTKLAGRSMVAGGAGRDLTRCRCSGPGSAVLVRAQ